MYRPQEVAVKFLVLLVILLPVLAGAEICKVSAEQLEELKKISNCAMAKSYRECAVKTGSGVDGNSIGGSQGIALGAEAASLTAKDIKNAQKKNAFYFWFEWPFAFATDLDADFAMHVNKLAEEIDTKVGRLRHLNNLALKDLEDAAYRIRLDTIEDARERATEAFLKENQSRPGHGGLEFRLEKLRELPRTDVKGRNALWAEIRDFAGANLPNATEYRQHLNPNPFQVSGRNLESDAKFLQEALAKGSLKGDDEIIARGFSQSRAALSRHGELLQAEFDANRGFLEKSHSKLTVARDGQLVSAWVGTIVTKYESSADPSSSTVRVLEHISPGEEYQNPKEQAKKIIKGGQAKLAETEQQAARAELDEAVKIAKTAGKKASTKALALAAAGPAGALMALKDNLAMAADIVSWGGEGTACMETATDKGGYTPYYPDESGSLCAASPDIKAANYNKFLNIPDFRLQKAILGANVDLCAVTQQMVDLYRPTNWSLKCTADGFEASNAKLKVNSKVFFERDTGLPFKIVFEGNVGAVENGRTALLLEKGSVESICARKPEGRVNTAVRSFANWVEGGVDKRFCHPSYNDEIKFDPSLTKGGLFEKPLRREEKENSQKIGEQGIKFLQANTFAFNEMAQCCSKSSTTFSADRCNEYMRKDASWRSQTPTPNPGVLKNSQ